MEKPVNKTRILTSYYKFKNGGLCTRLLRAINALLKSGCEVHILAVESFPISHPNYTFHKFPWPFKNTDSNFFWLAFILLSPIYILFICAKYKITHMFAFDVIYAFIMQLARSRHKLPISIFFRADNLENHRIKNKSRAILKVEKIIEKIALRGAKIFCVSKTLLNVVKERNDDIRDECFVYFPNDIITNEALVKSACSEIVSLSCVGVYEERKNQQFLINVMQELDKNNWSLNLYGDGPLKERLDKDIRSKSMENKIILHGWVPNHLVWKNVDLLLMPSLHEGAPNAVLEALAYRIPVLASDIPEHREILSDEHLYKLDVKIWSNMIDNILNDANAKLCGLRLSQSACMNKFIFNWDESIVGYIIRQN